MVVTIRAATEPDLERLRELNEAAVPDVNSVPVEFLRRFLQDAPYFRVAVEGDLLLGFLMALAPDADYDSPNFLWFRSRHARFLYIDRVVVDGAARGRGIGRMFYKDLESFGRQRVPCLTCEVNLRPRNDGSLRFHEQLGFRQVGTQRTEGGAKEVSLLLKEIGPA